MNPCLRMMARPATLRQIVLAEPAFIPAVHPLVLESIVTVLQPQVEVTQPPVFVPSVFIKSEPVVEEPVLVVAEPLPEVIVEPVSVVVPAAAAPEPVVVPLPEPVVVEVFVPPPAPEKVIEVFVAPSAPQPVVIAPTVFSTDKKTLTVARKVSFWSKLWSKFKFKIRSFFTRK